MAACTKGWRTPCLPTAPAIGWSGSNSSLDATLAGLEEKALTRPWPSSSLPHSPGIRESPHCFCSASFCLRSLAFTKAVGSNRDARLPKGEKRGHFITVLCHSSTRSGRRWPEDPQLLGYTDQASINMQGVLGKVYPPSPGGDGDCR